MAKNFKLSLKVSRRIKSPQIEPTIYDPVTSFGLNN